MALVPGTAVVARPDFVVFPCTFDNNNADTATLTNGTTLGFNFRGPGGELVPPVAAIGQLNTQIAASEWVGVAISGNNVVITKSGAGAGSGAASAFHLYLWGPKSKNVA
jgi:hypothetical protein